MTSPPLRRLVIGLLAVLVVAGLPAHAQNINPGPDYFTTLNNGNTYVTLPDGDVESFCGAVPDPSWDHVVRFGGVPVVADADTIVQRLDTAVFSSNGTATTRIQVRALHFRGLNTSSSPCGTLAWEATLDPAQVQPITRMGITKTSKKGGVFSADLSVNVRLTATDVNTGSVVGFLPYSINLPDSAGGTPWSYGGLTGFRPTVDPNDNCFAAARRKLAAGICPPICLPPSQHEYYIAQYEALGICPRNPQ